MDVVVRSGQEQIFAFSHIEMRDFDHSGLTTTLRYTLISNKITTKEDGTQTISVPTKLVGVDISQLYDRAIPRQNQKDQSGTDDNEPPVLEEAHDSEIVGALKQEFANHDLPSVKQILQQYAEETGLEWNVEETKGMRPEKKQKGQIHLSF